MKTRLLILLFYISIVLCNITTAWAQDKLILSAPPRETIQAGEEQYGGIAKELSNLLGMEVVYEHPENWTQYSSQVRAGKYDLVFDGPHFAAWRMKHVNHVPVARLPGTLKFYIVAHVGDKQINSIRDLIGKPICGLPSPNLGTIAVFALFDNPVMQPEIKVIKGSMMNVVKAFFNNECPAAVIRDKVFLGLPKEKQKLVKIIGESDDMPNQTITVSTKVSVYNRDRIQKFLTSSDGAKSADKLLGIYSRNQKLFQPADSREYENLEDLIEGVVFGW
ncbi:phosphate/phosphite/phosphonate ABC transporter substrate-binding protein [Kaarinaea lacus]